MKWLLALFLVIPAISVSSSTRTVQGVHIAVAANFASPIREITQLFEASHPYKVSISMGSSGKIYAQIVHGAPYDIFFSADQEKPLALENNGLTVAGSRTTYAVGTLALWRPGVRSNVGPLTALKNNDFHALALANPKLAPYGFAAREVLTALGINNNDEQSKWVYGENVAQTFQFADSGNADLAFVALSQLVSGDHGGHYWRVPHNLHTPIRQDAVLLSTASNNPAAKRFLHYMASKEAGAILRKYGYENPSQ